MIAFVEDFLGRFSSQIIGTSGANGLYISMFLIVVALLVILAVARFPMDLAFVMASPLVLVLSLNGWLPPITLGAAIILLAMFWGGIILAIAGNK